MLLAKLMIWKLSAANISFLAKSYDMRNAFATGDHARLIAAHTVRFDDEHLHPLLEQHRERAVVYIQASDATLAFRPGTGGRMGDSNEPELFMGSFYPPVEEWEQEMAEVQGHAFQVQCPFAEQVFPGRIGAFVGDLFKILLVPDGAAYQARLLDMLDSASLSRA
eukprot:6944276-Pyramimonas_sp.AAC.1